MFARARKFSELDPLIEILLNDHAWLRGCFSRAEVESLTGAEITEFGQRLSEHIRREERELFERLQQMLNGEELAAMGRELDLALKDAEQACAVPERKQGS